MSAPVLFLLFIAALADHSFALAFMLLLLSGFRALTS
jgi:hypothetical protein